MLDDPALLTFPADANDLELDGKLFLFVVRVLF